MALERLRTSFIYEMLPKWASTAFDAEHGQFMECLELDGTPERTGIVRTRTAARLIYVYSHAAALGVAPAGSLDMAERAFGNLHRIAWNCGPRPGYARSFNRFTAEVTDPVRDLYDNACVLLALSWLLGATGKRKYSQHIEATIAAIDQTLKSPFGGWVEDSAGTLPRRQNPHMHYLEASLALCEHEGSAAYLDIELETFKLLRSRFFTGEQGPLRESFGPNWEVSDQYGSGLLEPGHMCQWVWLARRHETLTNSNHDRLCDELLTTAIDIGRFDGSIFLLDRVAADGTPLAYHRRLWPQVEMLKALLMQQNALKDDRYGREAEAVAAAIMDFYVSGAPAGCWHDVLNLGGCPIGRTIPASSLYHLWTAVAELTTRVQ